MTLDCKYLFEILSEFVDNELDDDTVKAAEEHLAGCAQCSATAKDFIESLALIKEKKDRSLSAGEKKHLKELIAKEMKRGGHT